MMRPACYFEVIYKSFKNEIAVVAACVFFKGTLTFACLWLIADRRLAVTWDTPHGRASFDWPVIRDPWLICIFVSADRSRLVWHLLCTAWAELSQLWVTLGLRDDLIYAHVATAPVFLWPQPRCRLQYSLCDIKLRSILHRCSTIDIF